MINDIPDKTSKAPGTTGEGFVRSSSSYRRSEQTRKLAEDIKKRSAEIRTEAERVRSMSMIILLNADMNLRASQKAHRVVLDNEKQRRARDRPPNGDDPND